MSALTPEIKIALRVFAKKSADDPGITAITITTGIKPVQIPASKILPIASHDVSDKSEIINTLK